MRELLARGRERLSEQPQGRLEAEVLLCHVLGVARAWLYANSEADADAESARRFMELIERRAAGEPVAYLTGVREFWSMPLKVTPDVLIPRPETELLVETALERLPPEENRRIADLGTGSGAIAVAIARERPLCAVHATDISAEALAVARENGDEFTPGRITFHQGPWLQPLEGRFDLLASNPPYVTAGDAHLSTGDCRYEPQLALTPGNDGLAAIRQIAEEAVACLESGGCLLFEHGYDQGEAVKALLATLGYRDVATRQDLEGRDRVTLGYRPA